MNLFLLDKSLQSLYPRILNTTSNQGIKGMESLDDAANTQDKLDLEFADGLKLIAKYVDQRTMVKKSVIQSLPDDADDIIVGGVASKAVENAKKQIFRLLEAIENAKQMEKPKFDATMQETIRILSTGLPPDPKLKKPVAGSLDPRHPLCYLREFLEDSEERADDNVENQSSGGRELDNQIYKFNAIIAQAFSSSTQLYRALLLRATAQTLIENWDVITRVTSGDIDRAAVSKTAIPFQRNSVSTENIKKIFEAYDNKPCSEWVQSWWTLIDHDEDGLIDEEEMNKCIDLAIKPVHTALSELVYMALEVCPVRTAGVGDAWFLGGSKFLDISSTADNNSELNSSKKISWRNRRKELKARNELTKTFQATLARHFRDQAEMPHRLRCIYAWADKLHQNNKIDSIIVDGSDDWGAASSIVGRKRYVELLPKISYPEFRKEQARHFPQLDKIGEEIAVSFKEDLWVLQGKRRQNKELRRDSLFFLLGVGLVDLGIGLL